MFDSSYGDAIVGMFKLMAWAIAVLLVLCIGFCSWAVFADERPEPETWCGLVFEPEHRCSPYDARRYSYPSDMDRKHVEADGYQVDADGKLDRAYPSPYVHGIRFRYLQDIDIEHVLPRSDAHDSGLCAHPERWREFASDPDNVTVASEHVNRTLKSDREPHEWLPEKRVRWYVRTWVRVKRKHGLSIDAAERDALEAVYGKGWCEVRE